ncbi:MAG: prepilin-type N-terminal cleavage/methylation domain-containing protein [Candidatus Peribacteria bacterium]|nr:prepilin-type N-terminal cleavage/methylation domain-containing protein [Candidatus Peribacteria bacterium]
MEKLKFKLNTKAFTLTELIVVIIIFAILAAISFI